MTIFVTILIAVTIIVIACLLIDRSELKSDLLNMRESRDYWQKSFDEEKASANRLYRERNEARADVEVLRASLLKTGREKRAAGIALGYVDALDEVDSATDDEIPF